MGGIAQICLRETKYQLREVSHHFGELLTSLKKYRAIWGIAAIVSQYRAIWATKACDADHELCRSRAKTTRDILRPLQLSVPLETK